MKHNWRIISKQAKISYAIGICQYLSIIYNLYSPILMEFGLNWIAILSGVHVFKKSGYQLSQHKIYLSLSFCLKCMVLHATKLGLPVPAFFRQSWIDRFLWECCHVYVNTLSECIFKKNSRHCEKLSRK